MDTLRGTLETVNRMITEALAPNPGPASPVGIGTGPVSCPRIWAVIICYKADPSRIASLGRLLAQQTAHVLIVDNDPDQSARPLSSLTPEITYWPMGRNLGTAGAMNFAWGKATASEANFVICFDQDSQVSDTLIQQLLSQWQSLTGQGIRIGAIGPAWRDARTGKILRALKPVRWRRQRVDADTQPTIEVDHLITSGCLINAATMHASGLFDESLFLDYVDIEWSLRARSKGFRFFVTRDAQMAHEIGDSVIDLFGRSLWVHRPYRQYFLVRNHLLLWRCAHIALSWKIRDAIQVLMKVCLLVALQAPRKERLVWLTRGLWDGLRGRSGPIM